MIRILRLFSTKGRDYRRHLHSTKDYQHHRIERPSRLETVAQLTGGVAHDFNNLLTAAMRCLDMIVSASKSERIISLAETALRSIDRGARMTQ